MRKLQYAEVAITNLYVDSVDEKTNLTPTPVISHPRR